MLTVLFYCTSI